MDSITAILLLLLAVVAVWLIVPRMAFAIGLAWSRGFHRGKHEFVETMIDKCTNGKDTD